MMTHRNFKSRIDRQIVQSGLAALAIALPLALTPTMPAQASWIETVRSILRGDTGDQATGRARGGAIRDETCLLADEGSGVESVAAETRPQQLVVLAPDIPQKTTQANPSLFMYVPFDHNAYNMMLVFELALKPTPTSRQVIVGPLSLPLPAKPGLRQFQLPVENPLAIGETYEWSFRLLCRGGQLTSDSETSEATPTASLGEGAIDIHAIEILSLAAAGPNGSISPALTVHQEAFGDIQRVDVNPKLAADFVRSEASVRYQAYLENGVWFDMVSALATDPSSEWTTLLAEFELADVDPVLQPLTAALEDSSPKNMPFNNVP